MSNKICIVDYGGGNIFSVQNTLDALGASSYLTKDPKEVKAADKILFPGQGSFYSAMSRLDVLGLSDVLKEKAVSGIPFLGVCVGMQVLFEASTEAPLGKSTVEGLGIFSGKFQSFNELSAFKDDSKLKVPHMGWNQILPEASDPIKNPVFNSLGKGSDFYFVHSYMLDASDEASLKKNREKYPAFEEIKTNYAHDFISAVWNGENLFACQFHPEKSGANGLKIIENFINL